MRIHIPSLLTDLLIALMISRSVVHSSAFSLRASFSAWMLLDFMSVCVWVHVCVQCGRGEGIRTVQL